MAKIASLVLLALLAAPALADGLNEKDYGYLWDHKNLPGNCEHIDGESLDGFEECKTSPILGVTEKTFRACPTSDGKSELRIFKTNGECLAEIKKLREMAR